MSVLQATGRECWGILPPLLKRRVGSVFDPSSGQRHLELLPLGISKLKISNFKTTKGTPP